MSVEIDFQWNTRHNFPKDRTVHNHCCGNLDFSITTFVDLCMIFAFFRGDDDNGVFLNTKAPDGICNKQQTLKGLIPELLHINTSFEL
jgi:hypothetical protein